MTAFALASLVMILVIATSQDLFNHRIPNIVVASGLLLGILSQVLSNGAGGALHGVSGMIFGMVVLWPLYAVGVMGAGDVKLMGAVGSFLDPQAALYAGMSTLMAGGVFGVALIAWHRLLHMYRSRTPQYAALSHYGIATEPVNILKERFPYAIAISAGTFAWLWIGGQLDFVIAMIGRG